MMFILYIQKYAYVMQETCDVYIIYSGQWLYHDITTLFVYVAKYEYLVIFLSGICTSVVNSCFQRNTVCCNQFYEFSHRRRSASITVMSAGDKS